MMSKERISAKMDADSKALLALIKEKPDMTTEEILKNITDWDVERRDAKGITANSKFVAGVGFSPKFVMKVFELKNPGVMEDVFVTEENARVVAGIVNHIPADMEKFESEKENLKEQMLTTKKATVIEAFVTKLREKADISVNENFLKIYTTSAPSE
jgi:hypothetical protein